MIIRYPSYYETFRCIAAECPDSCCKEWEVEVDEASARQYLQMEGPLGEDLRKYLRREEDCWYLTVTEGRCPMWRKDGLCRIQAEQGHDALCFTCRTFPRLTHDYGDFAEWQLELSCPAAAGMILGDRVRWVEKEISGGESPEYDPEDMAILLRTREKMLSILEDPRFSVPEALTLGLLYGYRAQDLLDGGEEEDFDCAGELRFAREMAGQADPEKLLRFYADLEILTEDWRSMLASPAGDGHWAGQLRALARYGVERYWLQAVADFDLVGRVKMVIGACLLVWLLGGDPVRTAQLYAKEIENNADNVETILDGAYSSPALTDVNLLSLLLRGKGGLQCADC